MRVNGLYGHVRRNDLRSVALFGAFLAAFQLLAALALVVPLAMLDPAHAPIFGGWGYVVRWVPLATLAGIVLFAVQLAWHVRTVRRRTDFRFVDEADEPRLCRIVEPQAIAAGIPAPYVGVIDTPALNAFACGIRQKDAVLVFTRGLIDGLDDDELAAVAAHEIMHVVNGDIRLIAATNVCLDTLALLQPRPRKRLNRITEALALPLFALMMPIIAVLILAVYLLRWIAMAGSHLTRLLIASAREFVADAEAVRLTQNPAALVSALRRIEGRSAIPNLAAGQDAMMIDGAHEGALATHPTIAERIETIIALTGSMALVAPARRDTRDASLRAGFGRRVTTSAAPERPQGSALARISAGGGFWRFGLTPEAAIGAIAAVGVFGWAHAADLGRPSALAKAFDPAPVRPFLAMGGEAMRCQMQGIGWTLGLAERPEDCSDAAMTDMLAAHHGEGGLLGTLAQRAVEHRDRMHAWPDGSFRSEPPPDAKLAEVTASRCYQTDRYSVGDRGLHSVTETADPGDTISLPRYLSLNDAAARRAVEAAPAERRDALLGYFKTRKTLVMVIHRFFGEPGLDAARQRLEAPVHVAAIGLLKQSVADPAFAEALSPLERAELDLLASDPSAFVPCTLRRSRTARL